MNWFAPALALVTQYLLFFTSQAGDVLITPSQHLHRLQIASTRFLHNVVNVFWSPPTLPPPTPTASCFIGSQKCMFTSGYHLYFPGPTSLLTLSLGSTVDVDLNGPPAPTPASKALDTYANTFNVQSPQQVDIRIYIGIVVWLLTMILGFVIVFARMGSAHARETPKIRRRRSTSALGTGTRPNGGNNHSFFSAFSRPAARLPYSGMVYEQAIAATRVYPAFPAHSDIVYMYEQAIATVRVYPASTARSDMVCEQTVAATRVDPTFTAHSNMVYMYEQAIAATRVDPAFTSHSDMVYEQAIAAIRVNPTYTAHPNMVYMYEQAIAAIRVNPTFTAHSDTVYEQAITATRVDPAFTAPMYIGDTTRGTGISVSLSTLRRSIRVIQEMEHRRRARIGPRQQEDYSSNPLLVAFTTLLQQQQTGSDNLTVAWDTRSGLLCVDDGITNTVSNEDVGTNLHCASLRESAETVSETASNVDNKSNNESPLHTPTNSLAASELFAINPVLIPLPSDDDELCCIIENASPPDLVENSGLSDLIGFASSSTSLKDVLSGDQSSFFNPSLQHQDEVDGKQDVSKTKITFLIDLDSIPLPELLDDELAKASDSQHSKTRFESDASGATSGVFTTHDNAHDVNETSITSTILDTGLSSHSSNLSTTLEIYMYNPASNPLPGTEVDELEIDRKMAFAIDPASVPLPEPLDDELAEALDTQRSETGSESDASGAMSEIFTRHDAHSMDETCAVSTVLDTGLSSYASGPFATFGEYNHAFEPTLVPLPEPSADESPIEPADIPLPEDNSGFEFVFDSTLHDSSIAVDIACCLHTVAIRPVCLDEDEDAKLLFAASVPLPEPTADEVAFDDPVLPSSGDTSDVIAHDIRYPILIAHACTDQAREEQSEGASLYQVPEVSTLSTELVAYAAEVEDPSNDTEGTGDLTPIATFGSIYVDCLTSGFGEDENIVIPMGISTSIYSCRSPESEQSGESFKSMFDDELSMDAIPQKDLDDPFELPATTDEGVDEEINEETHWTFKTTPEYDNTIDTSLSITQMFGASIPSNEAAVDSAEIGGPNKDSEGTGDMSAVPTYRSLHVASLFSEVEEDEHIVIPLGTSTSICSYRSPEQSGEIFKSMPDNSLSINATPREGLDDTFELPALAIEEIDAGIDEERQWTIKTLPEYDNTIDSILATFPEPSEDELATDSADVPLPEDGLGLEAEELIFDSDACYSSTSINIVGPHVLLEEDKDPLLPYAASFPLLEPTVDEWAIDYSVLSPPKGESYILADTVQDSSLLIASSRAAQTEEEGTQTPHATSRSLAQMFGASTPSMTAAADATEIRRPRNDTEATGDLTALPSDHSLLVAGLSSMFEEDEHVVFPLGTSMSISSYRSYDYPAEPSEESFRSTFHDEVSFDAAPQEDPDVTFDLLAPVDEGNDESVENKPMPYPRPEPFEPILELILEEDETEQEDEVVEQEDEVTGNYSVDEWAEIERQEEEEEMSNLLRDSLRSTKTNLLAILPPEMKTPQKIAAFLRFASKTSEGSSERRPSVNDSANSSSTEGTLSPRTPTRGTPDFGSGTTTPDSSPSRSRFSRKESNKGSRWISPFKYRSRPRAFTGSQTPSPL
ncbi:hypothetical protein ACEPAI_3535 [Sanghuangporus weigelae]